MSNKKQSPFKFLGKIIGGIYSGIQAGKANKKAEKAAEAATAEKNRMKEIYSNLDTSNPFECMTNQYVGIENTMEDLTVDQKAAEFQAQQFQQSQANIMGQMRGAAGGSGIAALAQSLAQQGQLASQKAAAGIGQQESANQKAMAAEASRLQTQEAKGATDVATQIATGEQSSQRLEMNKQSTLMQMAASESAAADAQVATTQQAKDDAWGGVIGGVGDIAGQALGLSDRRLKKNIKLIGYSPSGLKIYAFEYINKMFGDGTYQGVMSDEISNNAIIKQNGYDIVDYSKLDVEFKKL